MGSKEYKVGRKMKKKRKKIMNIFPKTLKMVKIRLFRTQNGQNTDADSTKSVEFLVYFRSTCSIFGLLVTKILQKSYPLIAKDF